MNILNIKKLFVFFLLIFVPIVCYGSDLTPDTWMDGLITDPITDYSDIPTMPLPDYLVPVAEPIFKTKITRITGNRGSTIYNEAGEAIGVWGKIARHHYSKDQPWNADETLLFLPINRDGSPSFLFLDGETYKVKFARPSISGDCRWHETNPALMMCAKDNELRQFNVWTDEMTIIKTFDGYSYVKIGPNKGNFTSDGDKVALFAARSDGFDCLIYTVSTDNIVTIPNIPDFSSGGYLEIAKSGKYVVFCLTDTDSKVYNASTGKWICDFNCNQSHYDLGYDTDGITDIAYGITKPSTGDCAGISGAIIKHKLEDCTCTQLTRISEPSLKEYAIHSSMRSNMDGWGVSDFASSGTYPRFYGEIVAIKTDGSESVKRLAHKRNNQTEYENESHPCPSRRGGRVIYKSNWNDPDGFPAYTFVVDARRLLPPINLKVKY